MPDAQPEAAGRAVDCGVTFGCRSFLIDFLRRPDPTPGHFRAYGRKPFRSALDHRAEWEAGSPRSVRGPPQLSRTIRLPTSRCTTSQPTRAAAQRLEVVSGSCLPRKAGKCVIGGAAVRGRDELRQGLYPRPSSPKGTTAGHRDARPNNRWQARSYIVPPPNGLLLADNLPRSRYILLEGGISSGKTHRRSTRPTSFPGFRVDIGSDDQEATAVDTFV
jgi:hypothetical protein